jgi:hypothetical protein
MAAAELPVQQWNRGAPFSGQRRELFDEILDVPRIAMARLTKSERLIPHHYFPAGIANFASSIGTLSCTSLI